MINSKRYRQQQGATLIIALIFMVLITVVALSSLHSSSFEIKVARSVKTQVDALNVAEEALLAGEAAVEAITDIASFPVSSTGYSLGTAHTSITSLSDLLNISSAAGASVSDKHQFFHVEYLGTPPVSGNSGAFGQSPLNIQHLFRITGIGILDGGKYKIVQSYYATSE